jgi:hypothetical protein
VQDNLPDDAQGPGSMKIAAIIKISLFILILLFLFASRIHPESIDPYVQNRREMIRSQIKARGVVDPGVIRAMETAPRQKEGFRSLPGILLCVI